jgi:hypothetical protein
MEDAGLAAVVVKTAAGRRLPGGGRGWLDGAGSEGDNRRRRS